MTSVTGCRLGHKAQTAPIDSQTTPRSARHPVGSAQCGRHGVFVPRRRRSNDDEVGGNLGAIAQRAGQRRANAAAGVRPRRRPTAPARTVDDAGHVDGGDSPAGRSNHRRHRARTQQSGAPRDRAYGGVRIPTWRDARPNRPQTPACPRTGSSCSRSGCASALHHIRRSESLHRSSSVGVRWREVRGSSSRSESVGILRMPACP